MKLDRLLAITMLLINRGKVTAKELAEQFEVSTRTILRDIEAISQAGIPVVSYQGVAGGFGIMESYRIDKQVLTQDEILSIVSALKGMNSTIHDRNIGMTLEKMKGLMGKAGLDKSKMERFAIDLSPWGESEERKQKIKLIKQAIEETRLITFLYTKPYGESEIRCVEPMTLALKMYAWYLFGYCTERKDYRIFKLSRMKNAELKDRTFIRREKTFEELSWEDGADKRNMTDIVLKFNPQMKLRVEDYFEGESVEELEDGTMIVRVSYPEDEWVYGFILGFGAGVEVLEPRHIRDIIISRARGILGNYKEN